MSRDKIAVIGIGCRFPGSASSHRAFWQNLIDGRDCITPTPADRYDVTTLGTRHPAKPGRLVGGRGGYIDGFDEFDPVFFGISPREAEHMDPQQRKLLEVAWEALEDGGQKPAELAGHDVGVFVGAFTLDYKILQFADLGFDTLAAHTATGTMMTMVSNRISHCFDFRGPSVSIDTACSSSLVAVDLACQSLLRGESCLALAGGTLLHMAPQYSIAETKGGFLSPDGRSCTFDASANGYVRAEGVGVVALKRLADAERDGDPIHAVIIGSGVNQDGRTNGITVPNADAQVALIERVCAEAGIKPGDLQYIEAHGTSTPVGDPVEAAALGRALSIGRTRGSRCYIASVKANIGHTESAAGIAGMIKAVLSLKHRRIPPHINLERINPAIDLASMPYEIPVRAVDWPAHEGPARAGVNAFGFGGTNAHVVLEEAPKTPVRALAARSAGSPDTADPSAPAAEPGWTILPLTARDPAVLPGLAAGIRRELAGTGDDGAPVSLSDLGYTLAHRRQHLESRLSVVYSSRGSLEEGLEAYARGEDHPRVLVDQRRDAARRRLVWVFTGMGPQWWAMGRGLFESEPVYREAVERCDHEIAKLTGWSLVQQLAADEADSRMDETWLAQPANFAVQVGLAALWRSYGVRPDAVVGHSTGEVAAFYEAGVYSLEDAVAVVVHRSRLQQRLTGTGTMLAVNLTAAEAARRVRPYGDRVSLAASNSPGSVTLSGDRDALEELAAELHDGQVFARFLSVRVPYHSGRMDPIKEELLSSLADLKPRAAQVPVYLTGREGTARGTELDAGYWWENVRGSVRFRAAVDRLADDGFGVFLEIGPHPVLGQAMQECLAARGVEGRTLPSIRRLRDEPEQFMRSLASLHNMGVDVAWDVLQPAGRPVTLPPYPWKRDRYWTEPEPVRQIRLGRHDHPLLGRRMAHAEPAWETKLDLETSPYLSDHRVQGSVVFPAAGYVEMAVQAVRAMTGGTQAVLGDIRLRKALFLSGDEAAKVQLSVSAESAAFTIASVTGDGREPAVHASGLVRAGQRRRTVGPLDAEAVRARSTHRLDGAECYAALAALGYDYGPAFQGIGEVWIGPDEALARIRPPEPLGADAARHHMHPALLDACFQTLLAPRLRAGGTGGRGTGVLLPLSIDEVRVDPVGDQPLWAHATVSRRGAEEIVGDISLYSDSGVPLGRISGFRAADVEEAATTVGLGTVDSWLTELTWVDRPLDADAAGLEAGAAHDWLVFADAGGLADEFAAAVTAAGGRCHLVRPGDGYRSAREDHPWTIAPDSTEDLARLFTELRQDHGVRPDGIVHLWNLDAPSIDEVDPLTLDQHTGTGAYSLIALARTLPREQPGARLHIVTRGAQAVAADDIVEPLGATAWGVGRVLRHQELTTHRGKLIDLAPTRPGDVAARRSEAEALLRELSVDDEDEIALRAGRRRTSRLMPATGLTRPLPLRLRADGSYLVTGAFGALGRLLCRTLVRRGARRLILVSRTALPERGRWHEVAPESTAGRNVRFVRELEELGAHPVVAPLDITDEAALAAWLADHRAAGAPPVRGVFHLAGQVRDKLVPEMDRGTFDSVYGPKVIGGSVLHRLLRDEPLDHFVLFASVASLLTTAGQTNYAAGNAFLDALAHHRRAHALPALSIDWGPWATGMIEELGLVEHYRTSRGMHSLSPDTGMAVLERVIGLDRAQLLVATVVDWPLFVAWYPSPPPLVTELAAEGGARDADEHRSPVDAFREADDGERRRLLTERFTALVAGVLRVNAQDVGLADVLGARGLDSLLAMELRARVHAELGIALPVVSLLSNAPVAELVEQLHSGLAGLLAGDPDGSGSTAIELYDDEQRYPLTQNQKALWFLKQLNPDGYAYNIGGAVEVRVDLDPELMRTAFATVIDRHPSLRANFVMDDGRPVQLISAEVTPDFGVFDVQDREWDDIRQMIIDEYRRPYDLERDALVRFRLFKRGPRHWVIMKAVHHVVSDAVSTFTFIEELLAIYEGLRQGRPVRLPPVPARYLDFLNRQNQFLSGGDARRMLDYWRSHLPDEVPVLALSTDRPRPAVQTHNGASEFFALDEELSTRVHALAREHNVTVYMVLLSAYYLLLHRYSGQDDIIVGSPVTGRTHEDFSSVYGYFVNPLPLYVNLAGEPSTAELLSRVRDTVLGGLDNQEYPFVLLVDKLGLRHDPSRSAVFQAMFILLTHKVATEQYGYRLEYIELPEEEGQFDITLSAYEDEAEGRFHCVFKYNTDLFEQNTMRRLASHYVNLLDGLTRAPADRPATRTAMLGAKERARILHEWSGAGNRTDHDIPVHELFRRAALAHPGAIAVSAPSEPGATRRLTYAEVEHRSRVLAHRLRARGVGEGTVVALCLDKTPELVVSLLAVLRAGGAYLPLDPSYPADRLAYMVHHADASLVVVEDEDGRTRMSSAAAGVLTLEELRRSGPPVEAPLDVTIDPDALAYVIYTSGSTGLPKAGRVSHRNLASAYGGWREKYRLDHDVRVHLQLAGPAFDVFTGDLVRALCSGGTLVLAGRELLFNTARLYETMLAERVDCGEFVPAVVRALMNHCAHEGVRLDFMRLLIVGSDAWKVEEYQRLHGLCGPRTRLVNSYGVTEATIDSTCFEGPADALEPSRMVPIGRPFPNSEVYILDGYGEPVPPGVPGELWIGGDGVTLGYAGDTEQTAQRFAALALAGEADARPVRAYRTGDLAIWDAEGCVHLLGRVDSQVKLRGHRIELGEVESRLALCPEVAQSVVTVRHDTQGEPFLCAYCVPVGGVELDPRRLRRHLAGSLPTFMIPSHFVALPALPLSSNGKVDPAALPAPRFHGAERPHEPPVTGYEVRVAEQWQAVLGLERIGLRDDFFEAGGSSIKLIELVHRLQHEFGVPIPVSHLFKITTLQGMAGTVERIATGRTTDTQPYLRFNEGGGSQLFCLPPAGGHGLVYRGFAAHLPEYRITAFDYLPGDDKTQRYADLVESLQAEGPVTLLGYSLGGNLAFEVAGELERRGREVAHVVIVDSYRIRESFRLSDEHLKAFEHELGEHLRKHTGSETVAKDTLEQAREYIDFCGRTPNTGTVTAPVSVISDERKAEFYAVGQDGAWHGGSTTRTAVFRGSGVHADMLDPGHLERNTSVVQAILTGAATNDS
ncbi:non-ribosomal peptide synthetase/type I polyketide synthase [Streptomyces sp. SP18CS02]|uniref:non-ribosomal peptide synthetase/type I polyketide synthase n=1 Tax=Streptomyces sp. SP18CS02 TaxID=3002531 RepID=UPI002E77E0E8|nr:non-ribosomal peptide synthetase/type I polyketide synthase [Streptomyces sp. SP18CS02]MEE1751930.1 amino acid adenylation domain-containing protein [Streptomyces sp. SP18CS02]